MKKLTRFIFIAGCILLIYAVAGTILRLPANKFCGGMAGTFFLFALIRWIGGMSENKKIQKKSN